MSLPYGDNCSYDFIADINHKLYKVQVKSSSRFDGKKMIWGLKKTRINRGKNIITKYSEDEVDLYALYSSETNDVYLVPFEECAACAITIRISGTETRQNKGVRFSDTYTFDAVIDRLWGLNQN